MKLLFTAIVLVILTGGLGVAALVVAAIAAGPTVAGGERAVQALIIVNLILAIAAITYFARAARALSPGAMIVSILTFGIAELFVVVVVLALSVLGLNR